MSEPFIFIGSHTVREGRLEDFEKYFVDFADNTVEPNEPRLLSFHAYVDPETRNVTVVQVHPDAASMMHHMAVITEHVAAAYADYLEPTSRWQIYGTPSPEVLEMVQRMGQSDTPITVQRPFAGFNRLPDL